MSSETAPPALLSGIGPGFAAPVVAGLALLGCAALVTVREFRATARAGVVVACLLGAVGVGSQLAIALSAPASQVGFVLGTVGGWGWYLGWLRSGRRGVAEQALAVGGLLWIGGTITLAVSFSGPGWPVRWSLAVGVATAVGTAVLGQTGRGGGALSRSVMLAVTPVAVAFGGPAVAGYLFGPELLFVLFLIWTVSTLIGWSHVRLAQAG
ncbi:hypothetical protein [Halovenus sp. HT40]|uniref:hypothetical protein n=1 Tax=Halovenus sp. HT40 TaxID=3126691 RepID=UPI00300E88C4